MSTPNKKISQKNHCVKSDAKAKSVRKRMAAVGSSMFVDGTSSTFSITSKADGYVIMSVIPAKEDA